MYLYVCMLFIYKIQFKLFQRKQGQKQQEKGNLISQYVRSFARVYAGT